MGETIVSDGQLSLNDTAPKLKSSSIFPAKFLVPNEIKGGGPSDPADMNLIAISSSQTRP